MVTTLDEYRQTHDVSPLSPVAEDELPSPTYEGGATLQWQTYPTEPNAPSEPHAVSPESTRRASANWRTSQGAHLGTVYFPETPTFEQETWPKNNEFLGQQPLPVRYPTYRSHRVEPQASVRSLRSLHSLSETPISGGEKEPPRVYGASTELALIPPPRRAYWDPVWLRELTLIALACLFAAVAVAVLALYVVSSRNLGLGAYVGPADLVYLWKYIPSAGNSHLRLISLRSYVSSDDLALVLALLLALWNCTDFTARLLQPWVNLKNGPSAAERTLFLDLISPNWLAALRSASLMGGYVPVLTMVGVALLDITVSLPSLPGIKVS